MKPVNTDALITNWHMVDGSSALEDSLDGASGTSKVVSTYTLLILSNSNQLQDVSPQSLRDLD